ncbi:MAG: hypothetical protein COZ18_01055 [Flexibacter sp. CG_4_10_14_3_um_filter_32_15]|nr:MAG: hypothetical protein COZ18_01055 [Flexibacter sp. CG_4_10_14_3_um_filter_32_15]
MIYPYQLYPLSENPYYNKQCTERQVLENIQIDSIHEKDIMGLSLTLVKTSLKKILKKYNYVTFLSFDNVCLELENDIILNNKIKKINISKNIESNYKLIAKNISYCSLYYLDKNVIDIFKNTHIDTLYIASDGFKRVDFENTTINVLIPYHLSNLDSLDIDFIVRNNKVKKAYSKEEAKQYLIARGQQDVY